MLPIFSKKQAQPQRHSGRRAVLALSSGALLLTAAIMTFALKSRAAEPAPTSPLVPVTALAPLKPDSQRGARVPWLEYEAESGATNGTVLAPSRVVGTAAAECSGRSGVTLGATGQYVKWTTQAAANSIVIRLSIPDAPQGGGINSTLNLYVNGVFRQAIPVTSHYSWLYGDEDNPVNAPGGTARRMFDESSALIGDVPAGATISLQKDAANSADYYTIDLIDLEQVAPPAVMPENFVSITDYGATPNDETDDYPAMLKAYNAAKAAGKGLWIPPGTFRQSLRLTVEDIAVRGAGMWHSKLLSFHTYDTAPPAGSNDTAGFWVMNNCQFSDFAVFGQLTTRGNYQSVSAFRGPFGTGSVIENVWGEHSEVFAWIGVDSSKVVADGLIVRNNRVRNNFADGITFASGTRNSRMENNHVRNTGDDAFALFASPRTVDTEATRGNTITHCTAQMPWRASGFGVYGGYGNTVENCAVYDTLTYPGLDVQRGFDCRPFGPQPTTIQNMDLVRCGGTFWNGQQYSAIWVLTNTGEIQDGNILIQNVDVADASYSGIQVQSNHNFSQSGVTFNNIDVNGAGKYGVYIRGGALGSGSFNNIRVTKAASGGLKNEAPETYQVKTGSGNVGW